jgi:hypothetical protein
MTTPAFSAPTDNEEPCVRCGEPTLPICENCASEPRSGGDPHDWRSEDGREIELPPATLRAPELLSDEQMLRAIPELTRALGPTMSATVGYHQPSPPVLPEPWWTVTVCEHDLASRVVVRHGMSDSGAAHRMTLAAAWQSAVAHFQKETSDDANP